MATLSELQARLTALEKAYHSGVARVQEGDSGVWYDRAGMRAAIEDLRNQIATLQGTTRRSVRYPYMTGKGL